jgi:two-component system OmpR family response regulator
MLTLGDKCAILKGERIPLTELEYSLLSILVGAKGEYVGREKLLLSVWGKDVAEGILNVYVHYLREKLEKGGEKIIVSSRKQGYKISERYKG